MTTFLTLALAASLASGSSLSTTPGNLEAALDAIRVDNIKSDIHFIASDELGGRDTPSPGLQVAARFIQSRLARLGVQPGAEDGYFYTYKLANRQIDAEGTLAWASHGDDRHEFVFGEDYFFSGSGYTEAEYSGKVTFCGTGDKEDFKGLDLDGAWALCFDAKGSTKRRARLAEEAGAVGLILTPGPDYEGDPYAERYGRYASYLLKPRVGWPSSKTSDKEKRSVFPYMFLTAEAGHKVLALARGSDPAEWTPEVGAAFEVEFGETRQPAGGDGLIDLENVCGFWPGDDPELSKEVIILSAHYDHVGQRGDEIYNGADDNGSGTVGLLQIAEALTVRGPLSRSVMLMWVSGEEKGLLGSRAWTENPWLPEGCRAVANINIDMIGRNAANELGITPTQKRTKDYNELVKIAEKHAPSEGFPELSSADAYWSRSDHANFRQNLEIPVAFLFSDTHEDYHRPSDTPDKIDYDKIRRVCRLVVRMLEDLQSPDVDLSLN